MKTTLAVCLAPEIDARIRAEAAAQRRPLSWVVEDLLRSALGHLSAPHAGAPAVVAPDPAAGVEPATAAPNDAAA